MNESLADKLTVHKVKRILGKLKNGKAAGHSDIIPDMLKAGARNEDFVYMLTDLLSAVWEERSGPQKWVNAILIHIPKKGNLHYCDNWWGIVFLDVVGKLAARLVQN